MKEVMTMLYVHAHTPMRRKGFPVALCGTATARYLVTRTEFGKLKTPPAPWCPKCREEIERTISLEEAGA